MPVAKEWATCYCNKRLNFGQCITLLVKLVNCYLKSFIITSTSTIYECVIQSINIVKTIEVNITEVI